MFMIKNPQVDGPSEICGVTEAHRPRLNTRGSVGNGAVEHGILWLTQVETGKNSLHWDLNSLDL